MDSRFLMIDDELKMNSAENSMAFIVDKRVEY